MKPIKIQRALLSVSDKSSLIPLARLLNELKVEIISTGGTFEAIKAAGIPVVAIDQITGFPEMLDGRVKTLHPKIHGGLLFRRDKASHVKQAKAHGIEPIDLVVVNLYPFEKVTMDPEVPLETAIENIDIGGPSMLRSAAKNFEAVTVVCDPADYLEVMEALKAGKGSITLELRRKLALKVFRKTSDYDGAIHEFLLGREKAAPKKEPSSALPDEIRIRAVKDQPLRYGENPHQRAALYLPQGEGRTWRFEQLHGKELSFNNFLDIEAAMDGVAEFEGPAACVIKHNNPSGISENPDLPAALREAIQCDALSAFGGILGVNRECDEKTAKTALELLNFFEVFAAPSYTEGALKLLRERKNLRIISTGPIPDPRGLDIRHLRAGLLVQDRDLAIRPRLKDLKKNLKMVTKTQLKAKEVSDLLFAFQCVKVVKSNAIVFTQGRKTVGIGAGQMSRVDSVEIASHKAGKLTQGAFMASDAFFPMPDSIEVAHQHGIRAIIQPGGSIRDPDVIAACDKYGIAMVFTGERHFKH